MIPHKTILLDIGGTFIKCSDGREIPVASAGSREDIVSSLKQAVGDASLVSAAVPGPFDYGTGQFLMKHKFAAVYGEYFSDLVGLPRGNCRFGHDVNVMLHGEMTDGNGKDYRNVALVTLGTGLGFSMAIDGKIIKNELGSPAVSIFNIPYRDGVLEDYVSKRGFLRGYEGITVKELAQKAHEGDASARARFAECGTIIAEVLAPILSEHGIECLLLGGQISRSSDLFIPALRSGLGGVATLRTVTPISDFDHATFNGLAF